MFNLPTLSPMHYRLWLPLSRRYVTKTDWVNRRIITTVNRESALRLPEAQALRHARTLIEQTDQVVELRTAEDDIAGEGR